MKKAVLILLITATSISCNHNEKKTAAVPVAAVKDSPEAATAAAAVKDKSREDKVLDSILKLPFIITAARQIDAATQHKNGIAFLVDSSQKEWMVQAGYNGPERFETYHRLYINPVTFDIKVYDAVNDTLLPVDAYLKNDEQ